jgi:hypothetical protein
MKYAKPQVEIRSIPPLTIDEEAFLFRENKLFPWKRMTRQEIEEQYPGALGNIDKTPSGEITEHYEGKTTVYKPE